MYIKAFAKTTCLGLIILFLFEMFDLKYACETDFALVVWEVFFLHCYRFVDCAHKYVIYFQIFWPISH